jgi:hypothetical protein
MATIKKRMQAGGTTKSLGKAPDITGDYITVQKRVLGKMEGGGRIKYGKSGRLTDEDKKITEKNRAKIHSVLRKGLPKAEGGKWIQKAIKKPGALRKQLGAKPGQPIPAGKLAAAAKKSGKIGQRARLAQTLKKMRKK